MIKLYIGVDFDEVVPKVKYSLTKINLLSRS